MNAKYNKFSLRRGYYVLIIVGLPENIDDLGFI